MNFAETAKVLERRIERGKQGVEREKKKLRPEVNIRKQVSSPFAPCRSENSRRIETFLFLRNQVDD